MGGKGGEKWKRGRAGRGEKFSRIEIPRDGAPIPEIWWARVRAPESRDERSCARAPRPRSSEAEFCM